MKNTLKQFMNTLCEVKTMKNELLFYGKIHEIMDDNSVSLELVANERGDKLPLVPYDTPIKIVLRKGDDLLVIGGRVYICNEVFWRLTHIAEFQSFERRGFFRVSTFAKGLVSPARRTVAEGEEKPSFPAQVINISLSGVMFGVDHNFFMTDLLQLHSLIMVDENEPFDLLCRIVAKEATPDKDYAYQYRCKFEPMSTKCADHLCKAIFELERENIKKMRSRMQQ